MCPCGGEMTDWCFDCGDYACDDCGCPNRDEHETSHDFTVCECDDCHAALLKLQADLDELERTDPDVAAAAETYWAMVRRITGRPR
jgi:hypothetical protein